MLVLSVKLMAKSFRVLPAVTSAAQDLLQVELLHSSHPIRKVPAIGFHISQ